ncbi:MAG: hypothetical protein RJA98_502 [Pseudomonadota bacterium]
MLPIFNRKASSGSLAITVQARHVVAARIRRDAEGQPCLTQLHTAVREGSEADDLSRLRRALGSAARASCSTLAEAGSYQVMQVPAPTVPEAEMTTALRWSVKDTLDFPLDEAMVDALPIPTDGAPNGRAPMVMAIAGRRDRIGQRIRHFQKAGLPLATVDVLEAAQRNLATLFEVPGRGLALLTLNADGGLLTFTRDGALYALRHIDVAERVLADESDLQAHEPLFERIALELQRSLDNFDRQFSQIALQRVLVAPHPCQQALVAYLKNNLYQTVEAADLGEALPVAEGVTLGDLAAQALGLPAIGLALRKEASA